MGKQGFNVLLESSADFPNSAYFVVTFDVQKEFGMHSQVRVRGLIDGFPYRCSIMPMGGGKHYMVVKKEIREAIGKKAGDKVIVEMEVDTEPRVVFIPEDLLAAMKELPGLKEKFEGMSYSHQKEYVDYILEAKKQETRDKRVDKTIDILLKKFML